MVRGWQVLLPRRALALLNPAHPREQWGLDVREQQEQGFPVTGWVSPAIIFTAAIIVTAAIIISHSQSQGWTHSSCNKQKTQPWVK